MGRLDGVVDIGRILVRVDLPTCISSILDDEKRR
jgi:hypothetical protein